MSVSIRANPDPATAVIDLSGRLSMGSGSSEFREAVDQLMAAGTKNVIVVMTELSQMDSTGLSELVNASARVTSRGGKLVLVGLSRRVKELLQLTRLSFSIFQDTEGALAALQTDTQQASGPSA
jgi:anti-sigma B factor antagonist